MKKEYFKKNFRYGKFYDALCKALELIDDANLEITAQKERNFEDRIAAHLGQQFGEKKNRDIDTKFIDQRGVKDVLTRVTLFRCDHRPDMSIGKDGIAIEIKKVDHGNRIREALGQAIVYRNGYRFVIVVLADTSGSDKKIRESFQEEDSPEYNLMQFFLDLGIYIIVK